METLLEIKKLTAINYVITGYFAMLYGLHHFGVHSNAILFIVELLTIPFVLAAVFFHYRDFENCFPDP